MLRRLQIEWMKLKNYRTFWILAILYLLSIICANYIVYRIQQSIYEAKEAKGMAQMIIGSPPYGFPTVWQTAANVSSYILFIPGLILIILVCNEFSYKTHRQNIIDGWNRTTFVTNKILLAFILSIISTIMVVITAVIFGMVSEGESFSFENAHYILFFFLEAFSYMMVAVLISFLLKRGGLAIGIYFLYTVILENTLAWFMNFKVNFTGRYLPLESTDMLTPFPNVQRLGKQLTGPTPNIPLLTILALAYLSLYIFFSIRKFKTDDL